MSIVCSSCMITGNNVCYHISVDDINESAEVCVLCTEKVLTRCECSRCFDCGTLYTIQQAQTALKDNLCRRCEFFNGKDL